MEAWERMWIVNYTDLAADARELGDDAMADEAMETARGIFSQADEGRTGR